MRATPAATAIALVAALCLGPGCASAGPRLPDTFLSRVEALAAMQTLNAEILASRSATSALEKWCGTHGLALPATIKAEKVHDAPLKPILPEQRVHLGIGPDEPVAYRRVRLTCGARVLSEADNWYVPSRLTPEMNRVLETTDTPFGKAVAALGFTRETIGVGSVWQVLPEDWEHLPHPPEHPDETLDIPLELFEHGAVLVDKDHRPIAEVDEHYMRDSLPFEPK